MIKLVLLGFQLCLEGINIVAELSESLTIGITIPKKLISKTIDSLVLLLCIIGCLFLLEIKLILQGIDLSTKSKLTFFLLNLLLLFVSDKVLDFQVFVSEKPVELVDFSYQRSYLLNMTRNKISCILFLNVLVLDLNVDYFSSVNFFQSLNLLTKACILLLDQLQLVVMSVAEVLVFCELVFEFSIFIIVGGF